MGNRRIHYEAAFEDYLRSRGLPYVLVDEAKKSIFGRAKLKSFDFVAYSESAENLLIDVKGRKFPDDVPGRRKAGRAWENWVTEDDLTGLEQWQGVFGAGFRAVLVFAYWLQGPPGRSPFEDVHFYREHHYAFVAIPLEEYREIAQPRSAKWRTLAAPTAAFARAVRDVASLL